MTDFRGSKTLITGAANGLGRLLALEMAKAGAEIIAWDIDSAGLDDVSSMLTSQGSKGTTYRCDLSDPQDIDRVGRETLEAHGHIDILINNAGIVSGKPLLSISDEQIERTFAINTLALFRTTRLFLPGMLERDSGHIVTVASAGGLVGTAKLTDYCSSKFAAVGFDESLRLELKRNNSKVRTTIVCPFYIDTGMFAGVKTRFSRLLPILEPEYVSNRIVRAIRANRQRLIMPRFIYTTWLVRMLPTPWFDRVLGFFGVNQSMDDFTGRNGG